MSVRFKSINSFYSRTKMNKDQGIFSEDLANTWTVPEQASRLLRSFNIRHSEKNHESSSEINEIRSDEIAEASGADNMTLMELQFRCKAMKGKVKRSLAMSVMTDSSLPHVFENDRHSKSQVDVEVDLTEPLSSFRRKSSKRRVHKENISKSKKGSLLDSQLTSSITAEDSRNLHYQSHVKVEIMDSDEGTHVTHLGESIPLSSQHAHSEQEAVSFILRSNELVDDIQSEIPLPDSMNQQDAIQAGDCADPTFISESHFIRKESIDAFPEILEETDNDVLFFVEEESDATGGDSHQVFPEPEKGSFHKHNKGGISDDGNETGGIKPSDLLKEVHLIAITKDKSHVSAELSARSFQDDGSIGVQGTEIDHHLGDIISSGSQHSQNNFRTTPGKGILDVTATISSPSMSENYVGSTPLQFLGDDFGETGMNSSGVASSNAIPLSILTFNMEPTQFDPMPTSEGSGCFSSTGSDSLHASGTHAESNDQNGQDCVSFQVDHISDGCDPYMGGEPSNEIIVTDVLDVNLNDSHNHKRGDWDGNCLYIADKGNSGFLRDLSEETTPGILKDAVAMPSCEDMVSSNDTPMEIVSSHISSNMLCTSNNHDSEAGITYGQVVDSLLNIDGCEEIEEHEIQTQQPSCSYSSLPENFLPTSSNYQKTVSSPMLDSDNDAASTSCFNVQEHGGRKTFAFCDDVKSTQPPKRLPSSRKVFSPTLKEKLYQALDAEEFYENMRYYRNSRRMFFDKWADSPLPVTECKGTESKSSTENIIVKPGNTCCTKGILKSANNQSLKGSSNPVESSSTTSQSQDAIKFSQRQMRDIDCVTEKLLSVVQSMKSIMEETLNLEEFSSAHFKSTADKMITAIESAGAVEATTGKYISMMNRDFKRFCKIMRSKENDAPDKSDDVSKKRRKITFADEAGGLLCHVKVFEEPSPFAVES